MPRLYNEYDRSRLNDGNDMQNELYVLRKTDKIGVFELIGVSQ